MHVQRIMNVQRIAVMPVATATALARNQIAARISKKKVLFLAGKKDYHKPHSQGQKQILH